MYLLTTPAKNKFNFTDLAIIMTYDEASWCVSVFSTVYREELVQGQPHLQGSHLRSFVPLSLQTGSGTDKGPCHETSKCKIEDVSWIRNCFKSS